MKKRHLQTSSNYKFQQQQQAKQEYHKLKKIKEKAKKTPVSAAEELDYIKKLLNGEEVEDFGPKELEHDAISAPSWWSQVNAGIPGVWMSDPTRIVLSENMSLSEYLRLMGGKGYYR